MEKSYSGTLRLGEATPSLDADTPVCHTLPFDHITDRQLASAAQSFLGDILQRPPAFSAIKVKGERMYDKARRGEAVELPPRPVRIYSFDVWRDEGEGEEGGDVEGEGEGEGEGVGKERLRHVHFRVVCSKGTYVRTLCADLATALGSCGHLVALRRESIGELSVQDSLTMDDVSKVAGKWWAARGGGRDMSKERKPGQGRKARR